MHNLFRNLCFQQLPRKSSVFRRASSNFLCIFSLPALHSLGLIGPLCHIPFLIINTKLHLYFATPTCDTRTCIPSAIATGLLVYFLHNRSSCLISHTPTPAATAPLYFLAPHSSRPCAGFAPTSHRAGTSRALLPRGLPRRPQPPFPHPIPLSQPHPCRPCGLRRRLPSALEHIASALTPRSRHLRAAARHALPSPTPPLTEPTARPRNCPNASPRGDAMNADGLRLRLARAGSTNSQLTRS